MSRSDRSRQERTAEERELARLERARQRAIREGLPDPGPPGLPSDGGPAAEALDLDLSEPAPPVAAPEEHAAHGDPLAGAATHGEVWDQHPQAEDPLGHGDALAPAPDAESGLEQQPPSGAPHVQSELDPEHAPSAGEPAGLPPEAVDALAFASAAEEPFAEVPLAPAGHGAVPAGSDEPVFAAGEPVAAADAPGAAADAPVLPADAPGAGADAHIETEHEHGEPAAAAGLGEPAAAGLGEHLAAADAVSNETHPLADEPVGQGDPFDEGDGARTGALGGGAASDLERRRAREEGLVAGGRTRRGRTAEAAAGGSRSAREKGGEKGGGEHRRWRGRTIALLAIALVAVAVVVVLLLGRSSGGSGASKASTPATIRVLIPEGATRLQIAQIAKKAGLSGSYRTASRTSTLLDPAHYGAPANTHTLEGFLFPATYDEYLHAPVDRLVSDQLTAFQEHFGTAQIASAKALHVTPYELLTIASMIEREAQVPADRAKVAAVIYNRLKAGTPLGIDATTYYGIELARNVPYYTAELTESDLHSTSAYNTRIHTGLPPTPISNPGSASIEAAAHPAKASYLYYVAGADGCGEQVFSNTQAEFETNVAAYQAAVRANGGKPPKCKKK